MIDRICLLLTCIVLVAAAGDAPAMELDTLLPSDIPGYGVSPDVGVLDRPHPELTAFDINLGGISIEPTLATNAGYDTQPNGAGASSAVIGIAPSIAALDPILGLGVYVAGSYTKYPKADAQNLSGYTVALGEHAMLPRQTLDIASVLLQSQETGFGLNSVAISRPINVKVRYIRGRDAVICGRVTLTPDVSVTSYHFDGYSTQNRTDYRQSLTADITPGGPARVVTLLHATESIYLDRLYNANTYSVLAGIADAQTGIWNIRLLGGAATRQPVSGNSVIAPVLEGSVDWMPSERDSLRLNAAREIDDPDQESAAGYTLTETQLSIAHEYLRNLIITASFKFSHAAYLNADQQESLYAAGMAVKWHLDRAIALDASYAFNDRQSNFLDAANQHIFMLGVTWSP